MLKAKKTTFYTELQFYRHLFESAGYALVEKSSVETCFFLQYCKQKRPTRNSISLNEAAPWGILPQPVGEMLIPHALDPPTERPTCERGQQRGARRSTGRRRTDPVLYRIIITLMRTGRPRTLTTTTGCFGLAASFNHLQLSRSGCAAFPGKKPGDILKQSPLSLRRRGVECVFSAAG